MITILKYVFWHNQSYFQYLCRIVMISARLCKLLRITVCLQKGSTLLVKRKMAVLQCLARWHNFWFHRDVSQRVSSLLKYHKEEYRKMAFYHRQFIDIFTRGVLALQMYFILWPIRNKLFLDLVQPVALSSSDFILFFFSFFFTQSAWLFANVKEALSSFKMSASDVCKLYRLLWCQKATCK